MGTMTDPVAMGHDAALAVSTLTPDVRAARDAKAAAYLRATGNDDLLEVLGLADTTRTGGSPLDYACPTCQAAPGGRCNKQYVEGTTKRHHASRLRLAGRVRT